MTFVPKSKNSFKEKIREYIMNGYIIRYDFREEKPIEIMSRDNIHNLDTMHNIGQEKDKVIENIFCSHNIVHELVKELEQDYSVRIIRCRYSGCCQYCTYGVYLD